MDVSFFVKIGLIIASLIAVAGASLYLKDDNLVEEVAEQVIESQVGQDIDLTPDSPE